MHSSLSFVGLASEKEFVAFCMNKRDIIDEDVNTKQALEALRVGMNVTHYFVVEGW